MKSVPGYVEIPVTDIERAAKFYGAIFDMTLEVHEDGPRKYTLLGTVEDNQSGQIGASLTQVAGFEPSPHGALTYFDAGEDIDGMLKKVTDAGGKVVIPKTLMMPGSVFATFSDSEGNTLAFFGKGSVDEG